MLLGKISKIKTGNLDVNVKVDNGRYPFFTCAQKPERIDSYSFDCECVLVAGNGDLNVKYYNGKFNAYQRTYVIEALYDNKLFMKYLYYFMQQHIHKLRSQTIGGIIKYIKLSHLSDVKIPLPSLDDQIRIATLLSRAEELIATRKENLRLLDEFLKSTFLEMFGDPGRNVKGWENKKFETLINGLRNGLSPSKNGNEKAKVYKLSAVTGDCFKEIFKEAAFSNIGDKYFPDSNDFLICRGNGNLNLVGKGYFYPDKRDDVMFPDTIISASLKTGAINKKFLEMLWKTKFIRSQIESNSRTANGTHKINQGVVNKVNILFPPLSLQEKFSVIANKVEHIKSYKQGNLIELENLYRSLSQKAFKGELDLSNIPIDEKDPDKENARGKGASVCIPVETHDEELPQVNGMTTMCQTYR